MVDIKYLQMLQKEFDLEFFPGFWRISSKEDFLNSLKHIAIALSGEVGEFSNLVKKLDRVFMNKGGEFREDYLDSLREELVDIFIYVLIGANLLGIDLGESYLERLEFNKRRFSSFKEHG